MSGEKVGCVVCWQKKKTSYSFSDNESGKADEYWILFGFFVIKQADEPSKHAARVHEICAIQIQGEDRNVLRLRGYYLLVESGHDLDTIHFPLEYTSYKAQTSTNQKLGRSRESTVKSLLLKVKTKGIRIEVFHLFYTFLNICDDSKFHWTNSSLPQKLFFIFFDISSSVSSSTHWWQMGVLMTSLLWLSGGRGTNYSYVKKTSTSRHKRGDGFAVVISVYLAEKQLTVPPSVGFMTFKVWPTHTDKNMAYMTTGVLRSNAACHPVEVDLLHKYASELVQSNWTLLHICSTLFTQWNSFQKQRFQR